MKNIIIWLFLIISTILSGCKDNADTNSIRFVLSAEYPPFEYYEKGKLTGFDVELANLIAKELGVQATFTDMQFSSLLPTLNTNGADAAISTINMTEERQKRFDFSDPYYFDGIAVVYNKIKPITTINALQGKKIACQLGTTMELWLKNTVKQANIIAMDNNNLAIEALKSNHVDAVLMDHAQSIAFSKNNTNLSYTMLMHATTGYAIAFKKGSPLKDKVNTALKKLETSGELKALVLKWIGTEK